ncbi:NAD(P)/FAD-dependent oxidoreductase [Micromonospora sp. DT46]|uniref:NAD(P)/FAD-dependent oxidoreductase n=1 Tax=Micromonospora sp. DT46 TaxID=3393435 RepID=UPI003CE8DCD3
MNTTHHVVHTTSSDPERVDVAVVGDGLIGLSVVLHLQRAGLRVALVGAERAGCASIAAAGMLTPSCEYDPWMPREFLHLLQAGLAYYPQFLAGGWTTASEVGFRPTDFTLLDLEERTDSIDERMKWMTELGFDCQWYPAGEICRSEPHLSPTAFRGGIRIRDEALVNPIALRQRLAEAVAVAGVVSRGGGLTGVADRGPALLLESGDGRGVIADSMVIAAGAWSAEVGRLVDVDLPLCPVKGQMIRMSGPAGLVNSVVFMPAGGCGSVVERAPGSYVAGTSEEYLSPTADNTAGVVGAVLSRLTDVLPAASHWRVEEIWSGFRPMTGDELPVIGVAADSRVHVATGHHRNGVLLAPVTGRLIAAEITGAGADIDLTPFRPTRPMRPHSRFANKY